MSLVILTKSPRYNFFSKEIYKIFFRKIFRIKRGPDSVLSSLLRGLNEINFSYLYNPTIKKIKSDDVIFVNSSIDALRWSIKQKKIGRIKKLICGPNMVISPTDYGGIISDKSIDIILQPSIWVKDFYLSINPDLSEKIKIWPSGVLVPNLTDSVERDIILVYFKNCDNVEIFKEVLIELKKQSTKFLVIKYGEFKQEDYYDLLNRSKFMVYISKSESQGIALQEAWARNVPTLVWSSGVFSFKNFRWCNEFINAPYLNNQVGLFFKDSEDFKKKLADFIERRMNFTPRNYVEDNLSDYRCVNNFIKLIAD